MTEQEAKDKFKAIVGHEGEVEAVYEMFWEITEKYPENPQIVGELMMAVKEAYVEWDEKNPRR